LTLHNLHYYQALMSGMRNAIESGMLNNFVATFDSEQENGAVVSETI
jgi:queuine tRNA-ribosyltransferase